MPTRDPVIEAMAALRNGWPDMERLFMEGQCMTLSYMLRAFFPQAESWYSMTEGHVYTKIDGKFYDIRGRHRKLPKDLAPIDWKNGYKPHRWAKNDSRMLVCPCCSSSKE